MSYFTRWMRLAKILKFQASPVLSPDLSCLWLCRALHSPFSGCQLRLNQSAQSRNFFPVMHTSSLLYGCRNGYITVFSVTWRSSFGVQKCVSSMVRLESVRQNQRLRRVYESALHLIYPEGSVDSMFIIWNEQELENFSNQLFVEADWLLVLLEAKNAVIASIWVGWQAVGIANVSYFGM